MVRPIASRVQVLRLLSVTHLLTSDATKDVLIRMKTRTFSIPERRTHAIVYRQRTIARVCRPTEPRIPAVCCKGVRPLLQFTSRGLRTRRVAGSQSRRISLKLEDLPASR